MAAHDELDDDAVGEDELDGHLEDLEDLDDEDFDPESADDALEPGLDDELVAADELAVEDEAIELSLSAVEETEEEEEEDEEATLTADVVQLDEPDVEAEEDDEEEDAIVRVVEDDDEDVEGLREGEFICSSCYLAKGPAQLADPKRQICVDCI